MRERPMFDFVRWAFRLPVALGLPILLVTAACGDEKTEVPADPAIVEFGATPNATEAGQAIELSWKTRDAVEVRIDAGDDPIPLGDESPRAGTISVEPMEPTTYRLTAIGRSGKTVEETIEVAVTPAILAFEADPAIVRLGETANLTWKTLGATSVRIADEGGVDVEPATGATPGSGTAAVAPDRTTVYFLTATGPGGDSSASLEIVVRPVPTASLTVTPARIQTGESATLRWSSTDAAQARLSDDAGQVLYQGTNTTGEISVNPDFTTGYSLVVEGSGGTADADAILVVEPVIDSFAAAPTRPLRAGMEAELSWSTRGARILILTNSLGAVTIEEERMAEGSGRFAVDSTGRFVLTASSGDVSVVSEILVPVTEEPRVLEFAVGPAVTAGRGVEATVELSWRALGATSLEVMASPGGPVALPPGSLDGGRAQVAVGGPTSFLLVARNDAGEDSLEAEAEVHPVPSIEALSALPPVVGRGDSAHVEWDVVDAEAIALEHDGVALPIDPVAAGSFDEAILTPGFHTFTLRAVNALGYEVQRAVTVVTGAPGIVTLEATPQRVANLAPLVLSWTSDGGTALRVEDETGAVVCQASELREVLAGECTIPAPDADGWTTYRAIASNGEGETEGQTRVLVGSGPHIASFVAAPLVVTTGRGSTLTWQVERDLAGAAPALHLEDDVGTVYDVSDRDPLADSFDVVVADDGPRVFQLTASTAGTHDSVATATVTAVPLPMITANATPPTAARAGDPIAIGWTTSGAVEVAIQLLDPATGDVVTTERTFTDPAEVAAGSYTVTAVLPHVDYRVDAWNAAGQGSSAVVSIWVTPATIHSFEGDVLDILRGEEVTLSWESVHGTTRTIRRDMGAHAAYIDLSTRPTAQNPTWQSELSNIGNAAIVSFPEDFTFPYGGTARTKVRVGNQGFLGFDLTQTLTNSPSSNWAYPSPLITYADFGPFWCGLSKANGNVWYDLIEGEQAIVFQWKNYEFSIFSTWGNPASLNFQAVLWRDGDWEFRYGDMQSDYPTWADGYEAHIGWQNPGGTEGRLIKGWHTTYPGGLSNRTLPEDWPGLTNDGSLTVRPKYDTTYTLVVRNGHSEATRDVSVQVHDIATIYPKVLPTDPVPGDDFEFTWRAYGVQSLTIEDDAGIVFCSLTGAAIDTGSCTRSESVEGTYHYTLRAQGTHPRDTIVKPLQVRVLPSLDILAFGPAPEIILPGEPVTLSWTTTSAQDIQIVTGVGDSVAIPEEESPLAGSVTVYPMVTTTYTFTATRQGVTRTSTVTVGVRTATVDDFGTATPHIEAGGSATLTWQAGGQGYTYFEDPALVEVTSKPYADVDISATGTLITGAAGTVQFPSGFTFPYFGQQLDHIRMTRMGYLSLGPTDNGQAQNTDLPHTHQLYRLIFPFWNDFYSASGQMFWQFVPGMGTEPEHLVFQWKNLQWSLLFSGPDPTDSANFQAALYADGTIEFRFGSLRFAGGTGTYAQGTAGVIGFQDFEARTYAQVLYRTAYPGGLANRTFRYEPAGAAGTRTVAPSTSTDYTLCTIGDGWKECETQRVAVIEPGDLAITELQLMPVTGAPQWFEVRNLSPDPIDLEGVVIETAGASHTITTGAPYWLGFGEYLVLADAPLLGVDNVYEYGNALQLPFEGSLTLTKGSVTLASLEWDAQWPTDYGTSAELDPAFHLRSVTSEAASEWCQGSTTYDGVSAGSPGRTGPTCSSAWYDVDWIADMPFIDIRDTGTRVPILAQYLKAAPVGPIGFDFPFFDGVATDVWGSAVGWLSFGAQTLGYNSVQKFPKTQNPALGTVAPFWMALNVQPAIYNDPNSFASELRTVDGMQVAIYQWSNWRVTGPGTFTMQAQLWENGDIVFAYADIEGKHPNYRGANASVGMDNPGGVLGISYLFKKPILSPWQSILFKYKGVAP